MPTTTVELQGDTRLIVALIGTATGFALVSHEIRLVMPVAPGQSAPTTSTDITGLSTGGRIIVGGFAAAALLSLLAKAGDAGRQLAVGLAVITAAAVLLTQINPVWSTLTRIVGGAPGATPTGSTTPTQPTQPTSAARGAVIVATQAA